jgi:hypothetical protein
MKNLFWIFIILIFSCKNKDNSNSIVVASATKTNILYVGIDNPISIAVAGIPYEKIKLKVDDSLGSIKGDSGKYIAAVKSLNYKILAYEKDGDKELFLDTLNFKIKQIPSPYTSIAGYVGDCSLTQEQLLSTSEIKAELTNFIFDMKFPIVSFNMSILFDGIFIDLGGEGSTITEQMKQYIKRVPKGGKILIEEVKVQAPEGIRKIPGIVITLK